jgi:uncharacterized cupredoxin-like copper-binding protein
VTSDGVSYFQGRTMKRIISLLALGLAGAAIVLAVTPFAGAHSSSAKATTIKVTAKEYKFILSKKSAPHGKVVFKVVNKGVIAHDFKIAGKKTKLLAKGKSATLTVTLKKGKHPYIYTVDSHAKLGMKGVFKST